jgi:hypothetical protein
MRSPTSSDVEAIKRNAFRDQRILVVPIDHPQLGWADRKLLEQIGAKLYGPLPAREDR